jgi:hypothetical protein
LWGYQSKPSDVETAIEQCQDYGVPFYLANCEIEFKENDHYSLSWLFSFKQAFPGVSLALSTYGRPDYADIPYQPWFDAGAHIMPQSFPHEQGDWWHADGAVYGSERAGWPIRMIHPTVGTYPFMGQRVSAQEWRERLLLARSTYGPFRGFNLYKPETTPYQELPIYKQLIGELKMRTPTLTTRWMRDEAADQVREWQKLGINYSKTRIRRANQLLGATDKQMDKADLALKKIFGS